MTNAEIDALIVDCGLIPINTHEWNGKCFLHTDSFIEGDSISLMQFAHELIKRHRESHALIVEQMGIQGYGTLVIAAAIRSGSDQWTS